MKNIQKNKSSLLGYVKDLEAAEESPDLSTQSCLLLGTGTVSGGWLLFVLEDAQAVRSGDPTSTCTNRIHPFYFTFFPYFSLLSLSLCKVLSWTLSTPIGNTKPDKNLNLKRIFFFCKSSVKSRNSCRVVEPFGL